MCYEVAILIALATLSLGNQQIDTKWLTFILVLLLVGFFLVWGGYSIDAWRYLSRFSHNPLGFDEEWLFWILGNSLSKVLVEPWPLKILGALSVASFAWAIIRWYSLARPMELFLSLAVLPLLPAFFLAIGNSIRQGIAATVVLHGIVWLSQGQRIPFVIMMIIAALFHQYSLIFSLAVILSAMMYMNWRWTTYLLLGVAPFLSFIVWGLMSLWEADLDQHVKYGGIQMGQFHYAKLILAYSLITIFLVVRKKVQVSVTVDRLIHTYIVMVGLSSLVLKYEVPFERLLLYSEFLLPFILPSLIVPFKGRRLIVNTMSIFCLVAAIVLWSNNSILRSLGYIPPS